jgi:aquaporin Z
MRVYTMEFIGTMFLVLAVTLASGALAPLAIGVMLMVMVYAGGHVSGAHYNPAVTLAVFLRGKLEAKKIPGYMIAQVLGALAAALIFNQLTGRTFVPDIGGDVTFTNAMIVEIIFTFALAFVILNVATAPKLEGNHIYGLAIGFTLVAIAFLGGPISGGCYNPAVFLGPAIASTILGDAAFSQTALYLIGPFVGGAIAAPVYRFLNPEDGEA